MLNYDTVRSRYLDDAVATAAPATLLLMVYDRLVRDLERAEAALRDGRRDLANTELLHAQDILAELSATLDCEVWDGADQLLGLYTFITTTLIDANITGDMDKVVACRGLVEPLREAWQQAAREVAQEGSVRSLGDFGAA
ncbi:MAG: flagellar export chaperone FliS [Demequina sp.]